MINRFTLWAAAFVFGIGVALPARPQTSTSLNVPITITHATGGVFDNSGNPYAITALVPAINYNNGGQGVGFSAVARTDTSECQVNGTTYRSDYFNFKVSPWTAQSSIPNILCGSLTAGEFHNYQISAASTGSYVLTLYSINTNSGAVWTIKVDGTAVTTVSMNSGADFATVVSTVSPAFTVASGNHLLTIVATSGDPTGNYVGDFAGWQGSLAPTQVIQSVNSSCGTSCNFSTGSTGTVVSNITVTMNPASPSFSGTLSLSTSAGGCNGTNGAQNGNFTFSGSNLVTSNSGNLGVNNVCILAAQSGMTSVGLPVTLTGSAPGNFVCDIGPNAPAIPAPANAAGFTHCAMNADFTSSGSHGLGIDFSQTSTWIVQCGSSNAFGHFDLVYMGSPGPSAPCSDATITTDPQYGGNTLHVAYTLADKAFHINCLNANGGINPPAYPGNVGQCPGYSLFFTWPAGVNVGGTGLPVEFYWQKTFWFTSASLACCNNNGNARDVDNIWSAQMDPAGAGLSPDQFEIYTFGDHTIGGQSIACFGCSYHNTGSIDSGGNIGASPDFTHKHTFAELNTSDGSANGSVCLYMDGSWVGCSIITGPSGLWTPIAIWAVISNLGFADCANDSFAGCLQQQVDEYISSEQFWTCSNWTVANPNGTCPGTIVTSDIPSRNQYAQNPPPTNETVSPQELARRVDARLTSNIPRKGYEPKRKPLEPEDLVKSAVEWIENVVPRLGSAAVSFIDPAHAENVLLP